MENSVTIFPVLLFVIHYIMHKYYVMLLDSTNVAYFTLNHSVYWPNDYTNAVYNECSCFVM